MSRACCVRRTTTSSRTYGRPRSSPRIFPGSFAYDGDGRLISACSGTTCGGSGVNRVDDLYDGSGHRTQIRETTAGGTVTTTDLRYAGDTLVQESVAGTVTRTYAADDTGRIVQVCDPDCAIGTIYLVAWNGHGDATGLWRQNTDGTLTLANSYTYGTWGTPTTTVASGFADLGFRFLYVGASDVQWDSSFGLGLLYMHARTYSPTLGRFLQPDPARADGDLYAYAGNSPVTKVDPGGLDGSCRTLPRWWALVCDLSISGYVLLAPIFTLVFGWLLFGPSSNSSVVHLSPRGARIVDTMCAVGTKGCLMMAAGAKRVDLKGEIERAGWRFKRAGAEHDVYTKPGSPNIYLPRHRQISPGVTRQICDIIEKG